MPSLLVGSWSLEQSENFEEYLKAVGVDTTTRLSAKDVKQVVIIEKNGDAWTIKSQSTFKNHEFTGKLGQEFDLTTIDGRHVKVTLREEGENKLVQMEKGGKVDSVFTREIVDPNYLLLTVEAGGVTCKRHYKRNPVGKM